MTNGFGLVALTRVLQAKGDYAGALQVVEELETRLRENSRPRELDEDFYTLKIRTQLAGGDLQNPAYWADQVHLSEGFSRHKEHFRLVLGRVWLAQGRYAEVEQLLAGTTPPIAAGSQIRRQLESDLLLAAAIAGQGRPQEALSLEPIRKIN
jgi:ATP/maltotriose-dependent transcriptional regulator MalT